MAEALRRNCDVPRIKSENPLVRLLIRASFYPTLFLNRAMCAVGVWRRWDWIDEHVAVGALPSVRFLQQLADASISALVNLCVEYGGNKRRLAALGITQLHLPTLDYHRPSADDSARAVDFIKQQIEAGKKTYIHCKAGRGRSVTVVIGYLMATRQISAEEAFLHVKSIRPNIDSDIPHAPEVVAYAERIGLKS